MSFLDNLGNSFGNMTNDPKQMGLLMAAASMMTNSGPSNRPIGLGEIMGGGMSAYLGTKNAMTTQQAEAAEREQLKQYRGVQMQGLQQQQEAARAALARSMKAQGVLSGYKSPRDQKLATMSGPTLANTEQLAQMPQGGDMYSELMGRAQLLNSEGLTAEALEMAEVASKFKPKFDTTPRVANGPDGKPFTYLLDEMGNPKRLDGFMPREEKKLLNLNNKFQAVNPFEVADGASFEIGRSADSVASNALGWANHNQSKERLNFERSQNGKAPSGYRWSADGQSLIPISGGPADKGATATEGERKAATLLQRMNGSFAQYQDAIKDKPSAATPGLVASGLRAIGADALANTAATSSERQRVEAAQLDTLDAALTLGTGAAYTREQLEGYRRSYFPQIGDSEDTIKDKEARLKNVMKAAELQAGRAAPKASGSPVGNPRSVTRTGTLNGRKVVQYSDGSTEYAD